MFGCALCSGAQILCLRMLRCVCVSVCVCVPSPPPPDLISYRPEGGLIGCRCLTEVILIARFCSLLLLLLLHTAVAISNPV